MAKNNDKNPKVELTAEEVASLAQMDADEKANAKVSKKREADSAKEQAKVESLREKVQGAKTLVEGSPEWRAARRQRRSKE